LGTNKNWSVVEVNGELLLESVTDNVISIDSKYFNRLGKLEPLDDEIEHYAKNEADLTNKVDEEGGSGTNRRIYVAYQTDLNTNLHCISLIQLLVDRETNVMNVYLRSSDVRRFSSDLAFFCRLGIKFDIDILQLFIGSQHIYLEKH
tara:strand:- start:3067 stop:3507 length:441 start_codon:yes stop_codon:yes gene_type:complete